MLKIKFYGLRLVCYKRKNEIKNRKTTERHTYMCHQNIKSVEMGLTAVASNFIYFFTTHSINLLMTLMNYL